MLYQPRLSLVAPSRHQDIRTAHHYFQYPPNLIFNATHIKKELKQ
jgi:hypothetical protein